MNFNRALENISATAFKVAEEVAEAAEFVVETGSELIEEGVELAVEVKQEIDARGIDAVSKDLFEGGVEAASDLVEGVTWAANELYTDLAEEVQEKGVDGVVDEIVEEFNTDVLPSIEAGVNKAVTFAGDAYAVTAMSLSELKNVTFPEKTDRLKVAAADLFLKLEDVREADGAATPEQLYAYRAALTEFLFESTPGLSRAGAAQMADAMSDVLLNGHTVAYEVAEEVTDYMFDNIT